MEVRDVDIADIVYLGSFKERLRFDVSFSLVTQRLKSVTEVMSEAL